MKTIKLVKDFFTKPALSFDKIVLLGLCELLLIMLKESHGRFYGMANAIYHALFVAIILALSIQLLRLIAEVRRDK